MAHVPFSPPSSAATAATAAGSAGASPAPPISVPEEAQRWLWQGWVAALEPTLAHWSQTPAGTPRALPQRALTPLGTRFKEEALLEQSPENLLRLLTLDLTTGLEVLETFLLAGSTDEWYALLAGCCSRIGQLYAELRRRFGVLLAVTLLRRELKLLGHRAAPAVADLVYERPGGYGAKHLR